MPGTTRDVLEISLDVEGLPVVVADTAGLRAVDDVVERIGIQRAAEVYVLCPLFRFYVYLLPFPYTNGCVDLHRVRNADISLCVLSILDMQGGVGVPQEVVQLITPDTVFLLNKVDLLPDWQVEVDLAMMVGQANSWRVSAVTGDGMKDFLAGLGELLHTR